MTPRLEQLRALIVEAAVNQIALDDFQPEGPDRATILQIAALERDDAFIELINYVLTHGQILRLAILADQADRTVLGDDLSKLSDADMIKRLSGN